MDLYSEFSYWVFQAKVWVILGFILIIVDIFLGSYFILPIGIAAFLISGLIVAQNRLWFGDYTFFETWRDIAIYFAILSVISIGIIKLIFQKRFENETDINKY
jgi:membrane protein implicated in regulation of membrane protease activity|tara:strand:+ start:322 stop:630 length:309 start_codon:yes stop_codon:yes gene_type:complete